MYKWNKRVIVSAENWYNAGNRWCPGLLRSLLYNCYHFIYAKLIILLTMKFYEYILSLPKVPNAEKLDHLFFHLLFHTPYSVTILVTTAPLFFLHGVILVGTVFITDDGPGWSSFEIWEHKKSAEITRSLSRWKTLRISGGVSNRKLWNPIFSKMVYFACFAFNFLIPVAVVIFFYVNWTLSFILYFKIWTFVRSIYFCCFCWATALPFKPNHSLFSLLIIPFVFQIKLPFPACSFSSVSRIRRYIRGEKNWNLSKPRLFY